MYQINANKEIVKMLFSFMTGSLIRELKIDVRN